jgi:hypothetical protein
MVVLSDVQRWAAGLDAIVSWLVHVGYAALSLAYSNGGVVANGNSTAPC